MTAPTAGMAGERAAAAARRPAPGALVVRPAGQDGAGGLGEQAGSEAGVEAGLLEQVVLQGDLARLAPAQRLAYYQAVCRSLGLNPLTRPFEYLHLGGRLVLYARRDCADQLRRLHRISVTIVAARREDELFIVTARATTPDGRTDEATGVVTVQGLRGEALANALMRAETKAKRRVTLSICGLGWLDESEVSAVPAARPVRVDHETGEVLDVAAPPAPAPTAPPAGDGGGSPAPSEPPAPAAAAPPRADDQAARGAGAEAHPGAAPRFRTRRPPSDRPFARTSPRTWTRQDCRDYYAWSCAWLEALGLAPEASPDAQAGAQVWVDAARANVERAKAAEAELAELLAEIALFLGPEEAARLDLDALGLPEAAALHRRLQEQALEVADEAGEAVSLEPAREEPAAAGEEEDLHGARSS